MRTITIVAVLWSMLVASVVVAKAEDRVEVPAGCSINADAMIAVHTVLCHADCECTQRVVDVVCDYNTAAVLPNPYRTVSK